MNFSIAFRFLAPCGSDVLLCVRHPLVLRHGQVLVRQHKHTHTHSDTDK